MLIDSLPILSYEDLSQSQMTQRWLLGRPSFCSQMLWVAELTKSWKIKTIQYLIIPFWILILEYFYSTFRNHIILELCLRKTEKLKIKLYSKHLLLMLKLLLLRLNICKAFRLWHHSEMIFIPYFTDVNMNN